MCIYIYLKESRTGSTLTKFSNIKWKQSERSLDCHSNCSQVIGILETSTYDIYLYLYIETRTLSPPPPLPPTKPNSLALLRDSKGSREEINPAFEWRIRSKGCEASTMAAELRAPTLLRKHLAEGASRPENEPDQVTRDTFFLCLRKNWKAIKSKGNWSRWYLINDRRD